MSPSPPRYPRTFLDNRMRVSTKNVHQSCLLALKFRNEPRSRNARRFRRDARGARRSRRREIAISPRDLSSRSLTSTSEIVSASTATARSAVRVSTPGLGAAAFSLMSDAVAEIPAAAAAASPRKRSRLFIELEEFGRVGSSAAGRDWRETGRWNHALEEEIVTSPKGKTGRCWSRPHLPNISFPALVQLRASLAATNVLLDVPGYVAAEPRTLAFPCAAERRAIESLWWQLHVRRRGG